MSISILKSAATASDIGPLALKSMTRPFKIVWPNGQHPGTYLKLTDEDARAYEEYQSMLRQHSLPSSPVSAGPPLSKKLQKRGADSVIGERRPCRVI